MNKCVAGGLRLARRITGEFRSGSPILLRGGGGTFIVAALDTMSVDAMYRFTDWSRGDFSVLLGAGRVSSLLALPSGILASDPISLSVPGTISSLELFAGFASPDRPKDRNIQLRQVANPPWASIILQFAKDGQLLPAIVAAQTDYVEALAVQEHLLTVEREDLLPIGRRRVAPLTYCGSAVAPIDGCVNARMMVFRSQSDGTEYFVLQVGILRPDVAPLLRIHSSCLTGDLLGSLRCDCGAQLRSSLARIATEELGLLLYLPQEGRGIGLANKIRAYSLQDAGLDTIDANYSLGWESDPRSYSAAASILKMLSVRKVRILSNNPLKITGLTECGIDVVERVAHYGEATPFNVRYLATKRHRCGHLIPSE